MSYDSERIKFGREHINIVEIDVPRCVHTYGSAPCTASGSGDAKCYNTLATCQDTANYSDKITSTGTFDLFNNNIERTTGSFITDGFEAGQIVTLSGFTPDANNRDFLIVGVTALEIDLFHYEEIFDHNGVGGETIEATNYYTYKFCEERSPHPINLNNYAPCLNSVSIAPAQIDPKGGLGGRASVSLTFNDFPSSDRNDIDPYLSERTFDPLEVGTFWPKWRARNAYYENYPVRVLSGYLVDGAYNAVNFQTRHYVMSSMTATGGAGSITAKDPLQKLTNKKSLAPLPSSGTLSADITNTATTFSLNTGEGAEYPPASISGTFFYIRIKTEIIKVIDRSGDDFTVERAKFNTIAVAHSQDDIVQVCLYYTGQSLAEVQRDLLTTYAGIEFTKINYGGWLSENDLYLTTNPVALITEPTPVANLVQELCEQWPHKLYWDDRQNEIIMKAIKAPPDNANLIDQESQIIAGSFSVRDRPEIQLSTVYVYYGQFDPTKKLDEESNYELSFVRANTETSERYNSNNTKIVYSRWIDRGNGIAARQLAALIGRRFSFVPREISFSVDPKDSDLWIGQNRAVLHSDIVDQNGYPEQKIYEITSAKEDLVFSYRGLEYSYDGSLPVDQGAGEPGENIYLFETDTTNANLRSLYDAVFGTPTASTVVTFKIFAGVKVGSTSISSPGIETGSWPAGASVTLELESGSYALGKGGDGYNNGVNATENGGIGINLSYDLTLKNNGIIGGGGGGGQGASFFNPQGGGSTTYVRGGGGAGYLIGQTNGTTENGGAGGRFAAAQGGPGGDLGQDGSAAISGTPRGAIGTAGKAIELNGFTVTYDITGDIRGVVS